MGVIMLKSQYLRRPIDKAFSLSIIHPFTSLLRLKPNPSWTYHGLHLGLLFYPLPAAGPPAAHYVRKTDEQSPFIDLDLVPPPINKTLFIEFTLLISTTFFIPFVIVYIPLEHPSIFLNIRF